jgi:hypothetical protein
MSKHVIYAGVFNLRVFDSSGYLVMTVQMTANKMNDFNILAELDDEGWKVDFFSFVTSLYEAC